MRGYVDLHSHWVAGVDDGAPDAAASLALLTALHEAGFDRVIATPHMRPGMFDNTRPMLERAYEATLRALGDAPDLPEVGLSSEHYFDDIVFQRLLKGEGLLYPGGNAALVEFHTRAFPSKVTHRFFDLMVRGICPVLAHPERYDPVWKDLSLLDPLLDGGAVLLLDVAALAGKYGQAPKRAAEDLLEAGAYQAACSDAHKARDVADVVLGIKKLVEVVGREEAAFLLIEGPNEILEGRTGE